MSMIQHRILHIALCVSILTMILLGTVAVAGATKDSIIPDDAGDSLDRGTVSSDTLLDTEFYPQTGEPEITATRILPASVQPGQVFDVKFETDLVDGVIQEEIPIGFYYMGTNTLRASCDIVANYEREENRITFIYLGSASQCTPGTFSYELLAPNSLGYYVFDGKLIARQSGSNIDYQISGDAEIEVATPVLTSTNIKAKRTLPAAVMEPGEQFEVNIEFTGIVPGGVNETLPEGFTYVDGSESDSVVGVAKKGSKVIFGFMNEPESFSYRVTTSSTPGTYEFGGTAKGVSIETGDEVEKVVTGDTTVVIQSAGDEEPLTITTNSAEPEACSNAAMLNGSILSMGGADSVTVSFDWGKTDAYGKTASVGNMTVPGGFSATIENLEEGATYHFRAKAATEGETAYGPDRIFTMEECPDETTGPRMYKLTTTVLPTGAGKVNVDPKGPEYESGTSVTLKATANSGYAFDQWSGDASGEENTITITVSSNSNVFANFVKTTATTPTTPTTEDTATPSVTPSVTPTPTKTTQATSPTPKNTTTPTEPSDNGKPGKTYNITDIGGGNGSDSNGDDSDDGGGTNLWVIIGPLLGVAVLGCILAYYLVGRKPESRM